MIRNVVLIFLIQCTCNLSSGQAKIFEPGLISDDKAFGLTVSPDGSELFYVNSFGGRDTLQIYQSKKVNGFWQTPTPAFFADTTYKQIDPFISPDGNTILFNAMTSAENSFDIYALYRIKTGWTAPEKLSDSVNTTAAEFYATMSLKRNIYFTRRRESNDIYVSYFVNNRYQKAIPLDSSINTGSGESNPYISPKENYVIFFSDKQNGYGDADLYISFRKKNKWSQALNLGEKVNSKSGEFCPFVDEKNGIFYFSRTEVVNGKRVENIYNIDLAELNMKELETKARYTK